MSNVPFRTLRAGSAVALLRSAREAYQDLDNWHILLSLVEAQSISQPCSLRGLARATGMSRSTISRHLDLMIRLGWIWISQCDGKKAIMTCQGVESQVFSQLREQVITMANAIKPVDRPERTVDVS